MKKYLVYMTICLVNNKQYIGVHETLNPDKFDGYLGNGVSINRSASYKKSKTPFQAAVNKYGVDKFKRITLAVFDTKEEAYELESRLVNDDYLKREDTYNVKLGGEGGCPEILKVKVYMYDLKGNYIREFETVTEAARYLNTNAGHLPRSIKQGHQFHGYQFSYEKLPFMKELKRKVYTEEEIKNKYDHTRDNVPVGKYDLGGNLLETFECVRDCRNAGYTNVKKVLDGKRFTCKGFTFRYLNNN